MPASSFVEITRNRSGPTRSRTLCVAVKNTTFSCASQKRLKRILKLSFILMSRELALLFTRSNKQRCVRVETMSLCSVMVNQTTYITHQAADRIKPKKLNKFTLDVSIMGNVEKTYNTRQYQFTLRTDSGKKSQRYGLWYGQNYWSCN